MRYGPLLAFVAGVTFSLGLLISGMADPAKVLAFLDIAGNWDPSLALVMASAVTINFIGLRIVTRRARPLLAEAFSIPARRDLDRELIAGAAVFGVGWGLAGLCPGPAIAALAIAPGSAAIFVGAMLAGMAAGRAIKQTGVLSDRRSAQHQ
ncbi:MAG: YeeE/YedE family protein [Alphaproteobacteria bacterium]|nr:YeeE/YedE family protein [Alphaproteobacteria bacterium]